MIVFGRRKASILRSAQNQFLREFTADLNVTSVLNVGDVPDGPDKEGSTYRDYFPGASFKTLDTRPHPDPDYIQGDLMTLDESVGQFDLVLAMSVIEHVEKPWLAAPRISSIMKPGGHLYVLIPWFYPTHEGPDFGDHWRARPSGLAHLFSDLTVVRSAFAPTSIKVVKDRKTYWKKPDSTASGCAVLFQKPGAA